MVLINKNSTKLLMVIVWFVAISSGILLMFGCRINDNLEHVDLSNIKLIKNDTLTIGISPGFAPFESYEDGVIAGIDVDIAEMIAKDFNLNVEYKTIKYEALLNAVANNEVDMAISAINITQDRRKVVSFSTPYYSDEKILIAHNDSFKDMNYANQWLKSSNGKIACLNTSTAEDYIRKNYKNLQVKTYSSYLDINNAFNNNECDAALVYKSFFDVPVNSSLFSVMEIGDKEECAIAINKSNANLLKLINKELSQKNSDGTISDIISRWKNS